MRITRSRLRISSFNRSTLLVVRSRLRYFSGKAKTAVASSNPFSKIRMALGAFSSKTFSVSFKSILAVSISAASRMPRTWRWTSSLSAFGVASRILRIKWVWQRCQVTPWKWWRMARTKPPWSSEVIKSTPPRPRCFNQLKNSLQLASDSVSPVMIPKTSR